MVPRVQRLVMSRSLMPDKRYENVKMKALGCLGMCRGRNDIDGRSTIGCVWEA